MKVNFYIVNFWSKPSTFLSFYDCALLSVSRLIMFNIGLPCQLHPDKTYLLSIHTTLVYLYYVRLNVCLIY